MRRVKCITRYFNTCSFTTRASIRIRAGVQKRILYLPAMRCINNWIRLLNPELEELVLPYDMIQAEKKVTTSIEIFSNTKIMSLEELACLERSLDEFTDYYIRILAKWKRMDPLLVDSARIMYERLSILTEKELSPRSSQFNTPEAYRYSREIEGKRRLMQLFSESPEFQNTFLEVNERKIGTSTESIIYLLKVLRETGVSKFAHSLEKVIQAFMEGRMIAMSSTNDSLEEHDEFLQIWKWMESTPGICMCPFFKENLKKYRKLLEIEEDFLSKEFAEIELNASILKQTICKLEKELGPMSLQDHEAFVTPDDSRNLYKALSDFVLASQKLNTLFWRNANAICNGHLLSLYQSLYSNQLQQIVSILDRFDVDGWAEKAFFFESNILNKTIFKISTLARHLNNTDFVNGLGLITDSQLRCLESDETASDAIRKMLVFTKFMIQDNTRYEEFIALSKPAAHLIRSLDARVLSFRLTREPEFFLEHIKMITSIVRMAFQAEGFSTSVRRGLKMLYRIHSRRDIKEHILWLHLYDHHAVLPEEIKERLLNYKSQDIIQRIREKVEGSTTDLVVATEKVSQEAMVIEAVEEIQNFLSTFVNEFKRDPYLSYFQLVCCMTELFQSFETLRDISVSEDSLKVICSTLSYLKIILDTVHESNFEKEVKIAFIKSIKRWLLATSEIFSELDFLVKEALAIAVPRTTVFDVFEGDGKNELTKELESILKEISLSDEEKAAREDLIAEISSILDEYPFPKGTMLEVYGSFAAGFSLSDGDLDIALTRLRGTTDALLKLMLKTVRAKKCCAKVEPIFQARTPVLKTQWKNGINVDFTVANKFNSYRTSLMRAYNDVDDRVGELIQLVKFWAKVRGIGSAANFGLNSFSFSLLCIHYMQTQHPDLIPVFSPVGASQTSVKSAHLLWTTELHNFVPTSEVTIGELVDGFFTFLAVDYRFDPMLCITIRQDEVIHLRTLISREKKFKNVKVNMCIEDPIEIRDNTARNVSLPIASFLHFEAVRAWRILKEGGTFHEVCAKSPVLDYPSLVSGPKENTMSIFENRKGAKSDDILPRLGHQVPGSTSNQQSQYRFRGLKKGKPIYRRRRLKRRRRRDMFTFE